jgi:hypothetical protein
MHAWRQDEDARDICGCAHAALAVVHYKLGQLEDAQDLYARAYDIQVPPEGLS